MTRALVLLAIALAGCATASPSAGIARRPAAATAPADVTVAPPGPSFRLEVPAPGHAMHITSVPPAGRSAQLLADGRVLYDGAAPTDDPEVARVVLSPAWRLELHRTGHPSRTLATLDPATGELGPFGANPVWDTPAHIHCALQAPRAARCTSSWGHTPPLDVVYRVVGGEVVGRAGPDGDATSVAHVSPAPRTDAEAYAALFVWIVLSVASDDHGDHAHDLDYYPGP